MENWNAKKVNAMFQNDGLQENLSCHLHEKFSYKNRSKRTLRSTERLFLNLIFMERTSSQSPQSKRSNIDIMRWFNHHLESGHIQFSNLKKNERNRWYQRWSKADKSGCRETKSTSAKEIPSLERILLRTQNIKAKVNWKKRNNECFEKWMVYLKSQKTLKVIKWKIHLKTM